MNAILGTILQPIIGFIYFLLVTIPGVAMFLLLTILDVLTSVAFDSLINGGPGAKVFGTIFSFSLIFFFFGYMLAAFKVMLIGSKNKNNGPDDSVVRQWKPELWALTKSAIMSLVIVFLLPLILMLSASLLRALQVILSSWIIGQSWDNALFVATIMTLGYNDPNLVAGEISEVTLKFANDLRNGGLPLPGWGFGNGEPWDWNVALTIFSTFPVALSFMSIAIGTVSKIFETYFLFILAPIILFIKNYDPKTRNNFMQKVLAKMISVFATMLAINIGFLIYDLLTTPAIINIIISAVSPNLRWILNSVYKFFIIIATLEMVKNLPSLILDFFVQERIADGSVYRGTLNQILSPLRLVQMPINTVMKNRRANAMQRAQVMQNPDSFIKNNSRFQRNFNQNMNQGFNPQAQQQANPQPQSFNPDQDL